MVVAGRVYALQPPPRSVVQRETLCLVYYSDIPLLGPTIKL